MHRHSRFTVLGLAVLGLALMTTPAFAQNLFTVNSSQFEGVSGSKAFVPVFLSSNDSTGILGSKSGNGIYIPYLGTMTPCSANIGQWSLGVADPINNPLPGADANGGCLGWAQASIKAWANGLYYDPRFGTPFIPPSGDHHRTGYRLLMQPSFSGGAWLSGFAPLGQRFPFFPEVGQSGAGGDLGLALANASAESGLNGILALTDAHGEPLTTGKFPRYWPHERAAWVDTLMVKYTAGSTMGNSGSLFTQSLRSSVGFARDASQYRWRAMSNLDGAFTVTTDVVGTNPFTGVRNGTKGEASDGCGSTGWCEFYLTVDSLGNNNLYVVKNADGDTGTKDVNNTWANRRFSSTGVTIDDLVAVLEITQSTRLDTLAALSNGGKVLRTVKLNNLEKLPTLIDERLAQVDTDLDGNDYTSESFGSAGQKAEPGQALFSQIQILSGPNVHSEEGADPYAWVICGSRGALYGEDDCGEGTVHKAGAIDADGAVFAIVYNSNQAGNLGDSVLKRFGRDLNPTRIGNVGPGGADSLASDGNQSDGVFVICTTGATGFVTMGANTYQRGLCDSDPGTDGMYGTADDGTIYYKEAIENGLRGWIRETNGHAFSFLGADFDTTDTKGPEFGLTTMMQQNIEGFLMSCLNCNPHSLPANQETVSYQFDWPGNFDINPFPHPPLTTDTINILQGTTP